MKHRSTTSLQSLIGSQPSGQQQVKAIQSDQRCKHQQARFGLPYFKMRKVFCSLITSRKEEPSIANIILHYWCIWRKKSPKNSHKWRRKSALSPRQWTVSQINHNDGKTTWIAFWFASAPTLLSRFADLKRMHQEKRFGSNEEVISENRCILSPKTNCSTKKSIKFLEKHWNQCITLKRDYADEFWCRILPKSCWFIS